MSHTLAAECMVCRKISDLTCPECGRSSLEVHGSTRQSPYRQVTDGYVHQWHPDCETGRQTHRNGPQSDLEEPKPQ